MRRFLLLAFALLVVVPLLILAQQSAGRIVGTVKNDVGAALPAVRVTLQGTGVSPQIKVTGPKGDFAFVVNTPGSYTVVAELTGFAPTSQAVEVRARSTAQVQIVMNALSGDEEAVLDQTRTVAGVSAATEAPAKGRVSEWIGGTVGRLVDGFQAAPAPPLYPAPAGRSYAYARNSAGPMNTEAYDRTEEGGFKKAIDDPLSTFSVDVDTASYANTRRFLTGGELPPADAVRIEELVNYFSFDYPQPQGETPFSVTLELAQCPWNPANMLALVGLQGRRIEQRNLPARNLVFLIDVSGSMDEPLKLPLLKTGMRMLVDQLTPRDRVAIVVYAGNSGLVLPSTPGDRKDTIHHAIENLSAGGSTNGGEGIKLAYRLASKQFEKGAVNRVILATDGDFNVGVTSEGELTRLIEQQRQTGIFLSVLGFGTGNLKDSTMEQLADKGNGNYSYIDSLHEARKVLVSEAGGTLVTIAKDVKLQLEFNPQTVEAYRLVGYENRVLAARDFNDDKKDAGEIGAGHAVTALYEIVPRSGRASSGTRPSDGDTTRPSVDPLKYQEARKLSGDAGSGELFTVKLRYKAPEGDTSRLLEMAMNNQPRAISANIGFVASVAEFGMLLRDSEHKGNATYQKAIELARRFRGEDSNGYRSEFIKLLELADSLSRMEQTARK